MNLLTGASLLALAKSIYYPGYQRFCRVCNGELRFVGSRPTHVRPKVEDTSGEDLTETRNRAWKASGTQGNIFVESTLFFVELATAENKRLLSIKRPLLDPKIR